ncbi:hypothetical protein NBRC110019_16240 [Neptunitalea chrysea]|uniref:DUF218 domain-containing protein n=1 Tax=Neptunitalea chrysea TaxID=1647581 RepID=A0A9W6B4U4_9FLAO|nr:YdcF family protein [Neptunitalea chrysea]GLB52584.1 hypothetical protein NBRC110019_16240 [Neptunitalea chrysea]
MTKKKKIRNVVIIVAIAILVAFMSTAMAIERYAKEYYDTPSDVALVLGAGTSKGKISYVFEQRILHAVKLYKNNSVKYIIFTGGYGEGQTISDSKAAKNFVISKGVPAKNILIEESSTITFSNIKNARKVMDETGLSSALLVSDPYHMKRAMAMCNQMNIKALPSPTPTSMYRSSSKKFEFLMKETINYWGYLTLGRFRSTE